MSSSPSEIRFHPGTTEWQDRPLRVHRIDWLDLDSIQPHESVNSQALEEFCRSLQDMGVFYKPILVDKLSGTILDGTHRWAGLKRLGGSEVPSIELLYREDEEIEVLTWFPFTDCSAETLLHWMDRRGIPYRPLEYEASFAGNRAGPVLVDQRDAYLLETDPFPFFHRIERVFSFRYAPSEARLREQIEAGQVGFLRPPTTKQTVVEVARAGRTVPPKYTRHVLPYRYQHVMVKLEELVP